MTEERKVQLTAEFDASGVKQGVSDAKQAVRELAQEAARSGQAASQSLDGIGASTDKLTQAQQRVVESIKRTALATTDGKAALLEYKAGLAGVSDAAAPYIQQIRAAENGTAAAGHAMDGFSFATAGAKRELLVLVHELSQGNFTRFGASLLVLGERTGAASLLFSQAALMAAVLVGAVAALGIAVVKGAAELGAFEKAARMSGNAVGLSATSFTALRDSLVGIAGTKGKAAEVLTEITKNGTLAGDALRAVTEAAILMEKATGQSAADTIKQFAELAKSPLEASAKLNEQYNYLTAAVYKQIKAFEDQGRAVDAANLAEKTYAEALKTRATDVINSAGTIEKAWHGIAGVAKSAWDAMLGIGRELSPGEKLAQAAADVARIQAQMAGLGTFATNAGGAAFGGANTGGRRAELQAELDQANAVLASARRRVEVEASNTQQKTEQNRLQQLGIEFAKQSDEFLTKQQQKQRELTKAQTEGQQLVAAGIITQTELTQRLYLIRQKYNDTTGQSEVAAIQARNLEQQQYLARLNAQIAGGAVGADLTKQTENEKLVIKLQQELQTGLLGVARAEKEKALAAAQAGVQTDKDVIGAEKQLAAVKAAREETEKQVDALHQEANRIAALAAGQEGANATFGKTKTALEQVRLAAMKMQVAEADAFDSFDASGNDAQARRIAALTSLADEQDRYVKSLQQAEFLHANGGLDEAARVAQEQAASLTLELSLAGRTREERDKIVAVRKVEVALAKELADIDKLNLGTGAEADAQREQLKAKARANALVDANNAAQKVVIDEWNRTTDQINQSLTDALLRGFESGKDFATNFRDTLKNMFATLVLRPIIQGVMAPVSGAISGVTQSLVGGSSLVGTASSASSLYNMGSSAANWLGIGGGSIGSASAVADAGSAALYSSTAAYSATYESLVAAGAETSAAAEMAAGATTSMAATATGMEAALASVPVYGWIALAAIAAIAYFSGQGGAPKRGGQASPFTTPQFDVGAHDNAGANVNLQLAQAGIQAQYDAIAKSFGGQAGALRFGLGVSTDPGGTAQSMVQVGAFKNGQLAVSNTNTNVGRTDQELQAAIADQTADVVFKALKASALDKPFSDFFATVADNATTAQENAALKVAQDVLAYTEPLKDLGGVFSHLADLSVLARDGMIQAAGGLQALQQSTQAYYENFYSDGEKRNIVAQQISRTLQGAGLNVGVDEVLGATRAQFRSLVDSLDITTDSGRSAFVALMSVAGAFASITPAAQSAADATNSQITSDLSAASKALATARQAETDAMKTSISNLQQSSTRLRTFAQDLRSFRDSLLFGALSPLTPQQKYEQAKAQFDSTYALALTGDQGAMGRIQDVSQQFLEASQTYNASSSAYLADFAKVQTALTIGAAKADEAAAWAEQQATLLQTQLDKLTSIDKGVLSVADAIKQMSSAVSAALAAGLNPGAANLSALTGGVTGQFVPTGVGDVYASGAGAAATGGKIYTIDGNSYTIDEARSYLVGLYNSGQWLDGYYALKKAGVSLSDADTLIGLPPNSIEDWARSMNLPIFHSGTDYVPHTGLALLQQGEAVTPAAMNLGGSNGVSALVLEVQQLRAEVVALRQDNTAGTRAQITATYDAHDRSAGSIVAGVGGAVRREDVNKKNARDAQPA